MIGPRYWATGIIVGHSRERGWVGHVDFRDSGFAGDDVLGDGQVSTEGRLATRYYQRASADVALGAVVDVLRADAAQLGIKFRHVAGQPPDIYYEGDGENPEWPAPLGWREMLDRQKRRIGWDAER